ncbi:DUF4382 domain-containing protein [Bdellovibrio bacteriovorus]|uniref:DUF4382 domain-containing protein n=1 Tax=Bdellovibrio bacteriovorus TaxID=959 RepID=UPI0021CFA12A|nr:DUF4382 domain-containing protein [Bdellovibrio bacteriovorus]UXR65987.1 DUF4382 domain-containing protein [Bdellovibrio bacteriovorus]
MKRVSVKLICLGAVLFSSACSRTVSESGSENDAATSSQYKGEMSTVSFKLTDAPNKDLKSVVVDIDHMEVLVGGAGRSGRLHLAQGLGPVDLLQLQNGVTLPLQDIVAPAGLRIQQIRLVLKPAGHFAVKGDDSICELKTPSAQKTGVKIILTNKVEFEAGHNYQVVVDFDALKSVVVQGHGGCLLKPVLKLKSVLKTPDVIEEPGSGEEPGTVEPEPTPEPPGEELVTVPDTNDDSDDGYVPIVDGQEYPVVTEEELSQLL